MHSCKARQFTFSGLNISSLLLGFFASMITSTLLFFNRAKSISLLPFCLCAARTSSPRDCKNGAKTLATMAGSFWFVVRYLARFVR